MKSLQDVKRAQGLRDVSEHLGILFVSSRTLRAGRQVQRDGRQDVKRRTAGRQAGMQAHRHRNTGLWKNGKKSGRGFQNVTPTPRKKIGFRLRAGARVAGGNLKTTGIS